MKATFEIVHPRMHVLLSAILLLGFTACSRPPALPPKAPPSVVVEAVGQTDGGRELRFSGSLDAERSTRLGFATLGTVRQVLVDEGDRVAKGQVLARLASSSYADALGIARAKAEQAADAHRRLAPMYANKTLPEIKMVEMESGLKQARLAVSMAEKQLADTVLRSPTDGVVAERNIEPGASASPGLPAFVLVGTDRVLASVPVPEKHIGKVRQGMSARVCIPALGKQLEGEVNDIGVLGNPLTRTYEVKVRLPNEDGALRVGMIADVHLKLDGGTERVLVPPEAVSMDETGRHFVFVVDEDKRIRRRPIDILDYLGEGIALDKGLAVGELVVTSGTPMLAEGLQVVVAKSKSGS